MGEIDLRSIRILFDLQACQTAGSATRGVGRYSKSLFLEIAKVAEPREVYGLAASHHPFPVSWDGLKEERTLRPPLLPAWNVLRSFEGGEQDALDAALYASVASTALPDILHISHIFEGYSDRVAVPHVRSRPAGQVFSATLYDLIPMRFSDHYFRDERFRAWYLQQSQRLRDADLLLSISESSRRDAIELLGLDPSRIVTIYGGISDHFRPNPNSASLRPGLAAKYGIRRQRFILYTGGDDYRKNLQGAIEGYAALPSDIKKETQLVIVCAVEAHRKELLERAGRSAGLSGDDILFVGFVPEEDLVALYATCDLFVFPSLYEGLGLPVLEAMACGAPVIGGDNSSIKELINRSDAQFDSSKPESIAGAMQRVLGSRGFADALRSHGLLRARQFNWPSSARLAIEAFDETLRRKRRAGVQAAATGWLKRGRLAMLTPLPPARSGIADYNAKFLPFLAEHFDIDLFVVGGRIEDPLLNATHRVFDAKDFPASARAYDAILYEFGNSEFHAHMLPLLEQFPGVVGLHDAYLSGLMSYLQLNLGEPNRFAMEMLEAHAGLARRLMAPIVENANAYGEAMVALPCAKHVLDRALGVISHSPFNLQLARKFHPEGWPGSYRIIPQMVAAADPWSSERKDKVRAKLGLAPEDFVIATFGHIAWTKCGDRLLDAFLNSPLANDARCHLVFAGELANDDFGRALYDKISRSNLRKRIRITGFLSDEDYTAYLNVADVAVQLRSNSRGGTPKGVLDCLANGLPVIVNNEASYKDYPDDIVVKVQADPAFVEIGDELMALIQSPTKRREFSDRGRSYVREHHDPKQCARQYAAAIHEMTERHASAQSSGFVTELAPHLAGCANPGAAAEAAATFIASRTRPSFRRPRLVIDVSHISKKDHGTGVPRVVRETVRAAYLDDRTGFEAVAVERIENELTIAHPWLHKQGLLMPFEAGLAGSQAFTFRPGDHLLMLDSSWAEYDRFFDVFASARAAHAPITTAVYDLLPITLPASDVAAGGKDWFEGWIRTAIKASDNLICISRAAADELIDYVITNRLGRSGLRIGYWHLGSADLAASERRPDCPVQIAAKPYALMVGTIEPRKNHKLALDAFELLWEQDNSLSLAIAGRKGWLVDELMQRLHNHPQFNKKLFFFEDMSDFEIANLYRNAEVVLFPSKGEGFGLPLVEAARYGVPIICSDIPVFREIAGDHAMFAGISAPEELVGAVTAFQASAAAGSAPSSNGMRRLSWSQSMHSLVDVVVYNNWYWEQA